MKVQHINYGIACRIGEKIFMNKNLQKYPVLYNLILHHEKSHSSGFQWKDIKLDLTNNHLNSVKSEYYLFIFFNPSTWTEFLPFGIYEGRIVFSPITSVIWVLGLSMFYLIWRFVL